MSSLALTPVDYAILSAAAGGAVLGLFIGFSGALAFLAGAAVSAACAYFGWGHLADYVTTPWLRSLAMLLLTLLVFGLVRMLVRRFVHVMIAQPGDALFGAVAAAVFMLLLALGVTWFGNMLDILPYPSTLLTEVLSHVG